MNNKEFLDLIQSTIDNHGYHLTIVNSSIEPRYAYTIGLKESLGFELILAGGVHYLKDDLFIIIDYIVGDLKKSIGMTNNEISVPNLGIFSFSKVDSSWSKLMMLGYFDYYITDKVRAFQILPDPDHYTLDIPDMTKHWSVISEPVWQWLVREWDYQTPEHSTVVTNLDALRGDAITEVMRWEENEWEMFAGAGPDVDKEEIRVVSLGTILGIDKSLNPALSLEIGKGMWRISADSEWNAWVVKGEES